MNEPMGWGKAVIWGTGIVMVILGLLVVAYFALEDILILRADETGHSSARPVSS